MEKKISVNENAPAIEDWNYEQVKGIQQISLQQTLLSKIPLQIL